MESAGSFYVRKSPTNRSGWRLMRQSFIDGKRIHKTIKKIALHALGFTATMTIEQAQARAKQLNAETSIKREETMRITRIAERVDRDQLFHAAFIPEETNVQFLVWLDQNTSGKAGYKEKMRIHWSSAKKAIISLGLRPEDYATNARRFYIYFTAQEYSFSYTQKLLRTINLYGIFVSRLIGKYFEEIPGPHGHDREMINDAYLDSDSYFGASEPLTPELLEAMKTSISEPQYRWLWCSIWFGLRPSELDAILEDRQRKLWRIEEGEVDVLWVYQPKLTSLPRPKRWKPIPILFDEQRVAVDFLFGGDCDKPLTKTIQKYTGQHCTLYAGRKGFTDLMLEKGQRLEDVAQWLGHTNIQMTWSHYKDKRRVGFTKPA
jgi:integrase